MKITNVLMNYNNTDNFEEIDFDNLEDKLSSEEDNGKRLILFISEIFNNYKNIKLSLFIIGFLFENIILNLEPEKKVSVIYDKILDDNNIKFGNDLLKQLNLDLITNKASNFVDNFILNKSLRNKNKNRPNLLDNLNHYIIDLKTNKIILTEKEYIEIKNSIDNYINKNDENKDNLIQILNNNLNDEFNEFKLFDNSNSLKYIYYKDNTNKNKINYYKLDDTNNVRTIDLSKNIIQLSTSSKIPINIDLENKFIFFLTKSLIYYDDLFKVLTPTYSELKTIIDSINLNNIDVKGPKDDIKLTDKSGSNGIFNYENNIKEIENKILLFSGDFILNLIKYFVNFYKLDFNNLNYGKLLKIYNQFFYNIIYKSKLTNSYYKLNFKNIMGMVNTAGFLKNYSFDTLAEFYSPPIKNILIYFYYIKSNKKNIKIYPYKALSDNPAEVAEGTIGKDNIIRKINTDDDEEWKQSVFADYEYWNSTLNFELFKFFTTFFPFENYSKFINNNIDARIEFTKFLTKDYFS